MAARMVRRLKGRRRSGISVSGWRESNHSSATVPNSAKATKIARQPAKAITVWPKKGATAGTRMKSVITKDITRAIIRPW